jgi:hypothetical protein
MDLRPTVRELIRSVSLLLKHINDIREIHGAEPAEYGPTRTKVAIAQKSLEQYEQQMPSRDEIAKMIYDGAMRGLANESIYPKWEELPDSLCTQCAYETADAILNRLSMGT